MKGKMVDLHIHSTLSPCGSLEMSPRAIVEKAKQLNLSAIAVTDHNAISNTPYVEKICNEYSIKFFYGIELQTEEEIHLLCLFENYSDISSFYDEIYPLLPYVKNNPDYFGDQVIVDEDDNVLGFEEKLLLQSVKISSTSALKLVKKFGGIVIPAHIESPNFGLLTQLGFVPDEFRNFPLEISYNVNENELFSTYPELKNYPLLSFSDAHYLKDIARAVTVFDVDEVTLSSIIKCAREGSFYILRRQ